MKVLSAGCWVLGALLLGGGSLHAQTPVAKPADSTATAQPSTQHPAPGAPDTTIRRPTASDTVHRPTTPMGAMFRSFLFPGWGQAVYGRKVTAGVMMGFEGLSVGMLLKVKSDERFLQETGSIRLKDKRQQEQDWITLIVFTHLMSGLEAYVSAHLYDFPGDLEMRTLPAGGMGVGVTLPIGHR